MTVLTTTPTGLFEHAAARMRAERYAPARDRGDVVAKVAIVAASVAVLALAVTHDSHRLAAKMFWSNPAGRVFFIVAGIYGLAATYWTFWRLYLSLRYRPWPTVEDARLPRITVVVPAYNEGALVEKTLRHLAASNYPADKLQIIAVNDGSDDDTWDYMRRAADELGDRIVPLNFRKNRGKRWALWEGFRRGNGDIFVTVDSDSLVEPDALRNLVSPMVHDDTVGAVAGNVRVLNRREALPSRLLSVRYVLTFDYKRAAQGMMAGGSILCCAGALAAYRRKAVMPILSKWLNQTFLGGHARAGEDHAMTNFILSQGYKVRYQRTARCHTRVPTTYTGMAKMYLRWARSNIRESIHTARYIFTRHREGRLLGIRFNFIMIAIGLVLPYPLLASALVLSFVFPMIFGLKMLAMFVTGSLFTMGFYCWRERNTEALFAIPYSFYSTILLGWVGPYALMTPQKSLWLTRVPRLTGRAAPATTPSARPQPAAVRA